MSKPFKLWLKEKLEYGTSLNFGFAMFTGAMAFLPLAEEIRAKLIMFTVIFIVFSAGCHWLAKKIKPKRRRITTQTEFDDWT